MKMEVFQPESYQADDNWAHSQVSFYINELLQNTVLPSPLLYQHKPGNVQIKMCSAEPNCAMHQCSLFMPFSQPSITQNPQHPLSGILERCKAINQREVCV